MPHNVAGVDNIRVLDPDQRAATIEIARDVAARLAERARVDGAVAAARTQTAFPDFLYWQPYSVAQGYAGLALLYGYLDACFPGEGWDGVAHRYLELGIGALQGQQAPSVGLFDGLAGVAFTTWYLSRSGTRYRTLLSVVEELLLPRAVEGAAALPEGRSGLDVRQFDTVSGLSGLGAYLLCRRHEPAPADALRAVLAYLVALTREHDGLPVWYTPPHLLREEARRFCPSGNLNCGLAHGIPGPLALLSSACREGVVVEGMREAIERAAGWLVGHSLADSWGRTWPTVVPVAAPAPVHGSRTAWCYGSPGVARALWLAGDALDHAAYCDVAIEAMVAVYRRPVAARRIDSPTFCHGVAGLLQITLRFAGETGLPLFHAAAHDLTRQLVSLYEPASLLGYRGIESDGRRVDHPGLLDGAAGVALALLAAGTGTEPAWDRFFLLS